MQKHSYYLVKYLARSKVHVDLYHTNQSNYNIEKLEFFSEEEKKYIRSFVFPFPKLDKFPGHYLRESLAYSSMLFEEFRKNSKVDFVYVKGFSGWRLLKEKKEGFDCAPVAVNFHGYEMFQPAPSLNVKLQHYLLRGPVKFCVEHADYLFSYGGKITELIRDIGVDERKIIEVPTGIESTWLTDTIIKTYGRLKFLFVGRYERRKGVEELTAVLKELINKYDFEFHFAGPIPDEKKINSPQIIYHGSVTDAETMKRIVRSCDILVCPSYSEGMPNVIVEAMASGLAVIATDVGAVRLLVNEETGWLLPKADKILLRNSMIAILTEGMEELYRKKKNSKELIMRKFLWDNVICQTLDKINEITSY